MGPGYLNALLLLFFWHTVQFAVMGALTPITCKAKQAQGVGTRRIARLQAARERPLTLEPDQLARGRIDAASVEVDVAWEGPGLAERSWMQRARP